MLRRPHAHHRAVRARLNAALPPERANASDHISHSFLGWFDRVKPTLQRQSDLLAALLIGCDPVVADFLLRLGQRQLALADKKVQVRLQRVLDARVPRHGGVTLRPQVRRIVAAAQLQADQMIDLARARRLGRRHVVGGIDLLLRLLRYVAHRGGAEILVADLLLRQLRVG